MKLPVTVRQQNAVFPSAEMRKTFIDGFTQSSNKSERSKFVRLGVYWCLEHCNAYSIKQYSLRDHAVQAIKDGDIGLALQYLEEIGK